MGGRIDKLDLICSVTIELNKRLDRMEKERCLSSGVISTKPWRIDVVCNLIRGHTQEEHSDGASTWRG